jgi:hypothetical protein
VTFRCYVFDMPTSRRRLNSFASITKTEVALEHLHLFVATSEFQKLGVLRTIQLRQMVFRFGGYMNVEFRGASQEATHIEASILIFPFLGDSAYVSDADSLCEIGADHGYHSDPSLVLTFEIPFFAIGDALYGRLMKDVPFGPPLQATAN